MAYIPVSVVGWTMLLVVQVEHGQVVAEDIHNQLAAAAANKDQMEVVDLAAEMRFDHKGFAVPVEGLAEELLAEEDILEVVVMGDIHSPVVLKSRLVIGLVQRKIVGCRQVSRNVQ
jgi:hypothetical protein